MSAEAVDVRVGILEREIALLRASQQAQLEFHGEMRAYMAEQRAYAKERTSDIGDLKKRLEAAEKGIQSLENFKAKLIGAVAASSVLGGGAGALATAIMQAVGG